MEKSRIVSNSKKKECKKTDSHRINIIYPDGTAEALSSSSTVREERILRSWLEKCLAALAAVIGFTFILMLCYLWLHVL
jgi:hypothetical protein